VTEPGENEAAVRTDVLCRDERLFAPSEHDHAGCDRRRRLESARREAPSKKTFVSCVPDDTTGAARPWDRALDGYSPLDHKIGANDGDSGVVEEHPEEIVCPIEGKVGDYSKRLARRHKCSCVPLDDFDVAPAAAKPRCKRRI